MKNEYLEYFIEYDVLNNAVYVSGLDKDNFWTEVSTETDIAEPESYAWGYHDSLKLQGIFSQVEEIDI